MLRVNKIPQHSLFGSVQNRLLWVRQDCLAYLKVTRHNIRPVGVGSFLKSFPAYHLGDVPELIIGNVLQPVDSLNHFKHSLVKVIQIQLPGHHLTIKSLTYMGECIGLKCYRSKALSFWRLKSAITSCFSALKVDIAPDWKHFKTKISKAPKERVSQRRLASRETWISQQTLNITNYWYVKFLLGDLAEYQYFNRNCNVTMHCDREILGLVDKQPAAKCNDIRHL